MATVDTGSVNVRLACAADCAAIARIYNYYVENTSTSFEEASLESGEMVDRLNSVEEAELCWLVAELEDRIIGYAYATPWNSRCAYRSSVEISVYLDHNVCGSGLGSLLYRHLFAFMQKRKLHAVMAGIALPNAASVALHEKFGMQQVACFKEVGHKFGRWIDVGYWQVLLSDSNEELT